MLRRIFVISFLIFFTFPAFCGQAQAAAKKTAKTTVKAPSAAETKKKRQEEEFKKAEDLFYAQKTSDALPALARLCNDDYLRACSLLGFGHYSGRYGVPKNTQTGIGWYEKCAEKEKNFFCHNELGRIYYRSGDYDKALSYYQKGASKGDPDAGYWLGRLYLEGKGVAANSEKALQWLRRAAHARKNPSKAAQCALVEMSYFGVGMRRSMKDTNYWLKLCDNPQVRALRVFYGHGVSKNREQARDIMEQARLYETLQDWNDLSGFSRPSVGKKSVRDQNIPEDCTKKEMLFGTGRKNPKIEMYTVKIFAPDYYYNFDTHDGFIEKAGIGDQTFEACGITFYTTMENKRHFNKALRSKAVIKISRYKNACLGAEMTGVCDLNLSWQEEEQEEEI